MAVWCEKDGINIMITCPQDFESLVDPGVYNAMREYFEFGVIGSTLKSEERIEELESDLDAAYAEIEEKDIEDAVMTHLENRNDDLKRILMHICRIAADMPDNKDTKRLKDYLEEHEYDCED